MKAIKTNTGYEVVKNNQVICETETLEEAKKVIAYLKEKALA